EGKPLCLCLVVYLLGTYTIPALYLRNTYYILSLFCIPAHNMSYPTMFSLPSANKVNLPARPDSDTNGGSYLQGEPVTSGLFDQSGFGFSGPQWKVMGDGTLSQVPDPGNDDVGPLSLDDPVTMELQDSDHISGIEDPVMMQLPQESGHISGIEDPVMMELQDSDHVSGIEDPVTMELQDSDHVSGIEDPVTMELQDSVNISGINGSEMLNYQSVPVQWHPTLLDLVRELQTIVLIPAQNVDTLGRRCLPWKIVHLHSLLSQLDPRKSRQRPDFCRILDFHAHAYIEHVKPWSDRFLQRYWEQVGIYGPGFYDPGFVNAVEQALGYYRAAVADLDCTLDAVKAEIDKVYVEDIIESQVELAVRLCARM
ncbi:hypothetical protein EDC01DRAFT_762367, partial [Geopyxis carbonaria]